MEFQQKNIGIWGFGIVGKAAAEYLHTKCKQINILDKKELSQADYALAHELGASCFIEHGVQDIQSFITRNDYIIASPGIDTRPYANHADKFIAELDLFHAHYHKPIIAITGSVGKTTITHLIGHILRSYDSAWWVGGNIGLCMLEILDTQHITHGAILEISSFQLEPCKTFAPDIAIITNIHPNHLDRHGSLQAYLDAKLRIVAEQTASQVAILPLSLRTNIEQINVASTIHYFSPHEISSADLANIPSSSIIFYISGTYIKAYNNGNHLTLLDISNLPNQTFFENWLIICAVLFIIQLPIDNLQEICAHVHMPEHRLEHVATINGIDFYNDSKGTTTIATLAAVERLKARPIILILGGLSKGVDRSELVAQLQGKVKAIICCGSEREQLARACTHYSIEHQITETIEQAVNAAMIIADNADQIVLSPAGSSFDQFKNYEERGTYFKQCVDRLIIKTQLKNS